MSLEVREVSVLWSAGNHAAPKERHQGARRQTPGAVLRAVRAARSNLCNSLPGTAKLWCGQSGMGAESFGFVGRVAHGNSTAHHLENTYSFFKDIDMKRAEESSALIGERTSSTPLNFALGTAQRRPNCRARIHAAVQIPARGLV